jgi:hypothetical protein
MKIAAASNEIRLDVPAAPIHIDRLEDVHHDLIHLVVGARGVLSALASPEQPYHISCGDNTDGKEVLLIHRISRLVVEVSCFELLDQFLARFLKHLRLSCV